MNNLLKFAIPLIIVAFIVFWAISVYNRLVSHREFVRNAMGNIATQLESRWDAVKSLIDATKKYSEHEAIILTEITDKRSGLSRTSNPEKVEADDRLFNEAMQRLNVTVENYPQLKADAVYLRAMDGIDRYENNVRQSRMVYNDTVTRLNRAVQQFPTSLIAGMFGFHQEQYFQNTADKTDMPSW